MIASTDGSAQVGRTGVVIVAHLGSVDGRVEARTVVGMAAIDGTCVVVVTILGREDALSSDEAALIEGARIVIETGLVSEVAVVGTGQPGITLVHHARDVGAGDVLGGIRADLRAVGNDRVNATRRDSSEGGIAGVISARTEIIARVDWVNTSIARVALIKSTDVSIRALQGRGGATSVWEAGINCASISVVTVVVGVNASISSDSGSARVISAHVAIVTDVWADAAALAGAESTASKSTRVTGNINASGDNQAVDQAGESSERVSIEGGVNSNQVGSDLLDLSCIVLANSKAEERDSSSLGLVESGGEASDGVLTVGEDDEDSIDCASVSVLSSIGNDVVEGRVDSTTNASGSSVLVGSSQCLNEGSLRVGQRNDGSSKGSEEGQPHAGIIGSPGVRVGNRLGKVLHDLEVSSRDGSRFVEGKLEVDHLGASRGGAVGGRSKGCSSQGSGGNIGEDDVTSITLHGSADGIGGIDVDVRHSGSRGRFASLGTVVGIDISSDNVRCFWEIDGLRLGPSFSIADGSAHQISESCCVIEVFDGSRGIYILCQCLRIIVGKNGGHFAINSGHVSVHDVGREGLHLGGTSQDNGQENDSRQ